MLKKDQKYAIVIVLSILVGLTTLFLLRLHSNSNKILIISFILFILCLICGLVYVSKTKQQS